MGTNMGFEQSDKYKSARDSLPKELHEAYKQPVTEYAFYTTAKYGRGYVAYEVLAELIRSGWRSSGTDEKGD